MQVKKRKLGFWDTAKLMAKKDLSGFENLTGRYFKFSHLKSYSKRIVNQG